MLRPSQPAEVDDGKRLGIQTDFWMLLQLLRQRSGRPKHGAMWTGAENLSLFDSRFEHMHPNLADF